jgi:hypothetical protein
MWQQLNVAMDATKVYIMGFLSRQLKEFGLCKLNGPLVIHKTEWLSFWCCAGHQWDFLLLRSLIVFLMFRLVYFLFFVIFQNTPRGRGALKGGAMLGI